MPLIEVSNGDLADKLSILEIKKLNLSNPEQLKYVETDLLQLRKEFMKLEITDEVSQCFEKLFEENLRIWKLMQKIFENDFQNSETYELLARETVACNINRAHLKRTFDLLTQSNLREEKSFFVQD